MNNFNEMNELIENIGQLIMHDEEKPAILNPVRIQQIQFANTVLERLSKDADMKVTCTLHEPFKSMGSICVEGESLEFADCKWLVRAIEFASNVEIYPTTDGKLRLELTFHGLTTPINI